MFGTNRHDTERGYYPSVFFLEKSQLWHSLKDLVFSSKKIYYFWFGGWKERAWFAVGWPFIFAYLLSWKSSLFYGNKEYFYSICTHILKFLSFGRQFYEFQNNWQINSGRPHAIAFRDWFHSDTIFAWKEDKFLHQMGKHYLPSCFVIF